MRKGILAIGILICLGLGIALAVMEYTEDADPPVIQVPSHEIVYTEGESEKSILKDIAAVDEQDGDVSDSLIVESIYPNEEGGFATVVFVARDGKNNVAKKKVVVTYVAEKEEAEN